MAKLTYLTDSDIIRMSRGRVTDKRDVNLNGNNPKPYDGAIYDPHIFGPLWVDTCNCGRKTLKDDSSYCIKCKCKPLDVEERYNYMGHIELPVYFCHTLRQSYLIKWIKDTFDITVSNSHLANVLDIQTLYTDQVEWDAENEKIVFTDNITDYTRCSFEGLLLVLSEHFPNRVEELKEFINKNVLVTPIACRRPSFSTVRGNIEFVNTSVSVAYKSILYALSHIDNCLKDDTTEFDKALVYANLRMYVEKSTRDLSQLLRTSSENFARNMQDVRTEYSGRNVIVPSPELKADEIVLPTAMIYEVCKNEFIEVLRYHYDITRTDAMRKWVEDAKKPEQLELFESYVEGKWDFTNHVLTSESVEENRVWVIINRPPTLHKENVIACKVHLSNDYVMSIPQVLCPALAGDFDGDALVWHLVPRDLVPDMIDVVSPKNWMYIQKNGKPWFTPTHEHMAGAILASKLIHPEGEPLEFDTWEEANKYRKTHRDFKYQTECYIGGILTTLGYYKLTEYFGVDVYGYLENQLANYKNAVAEWNDGGKKGPMPKSDTTKMELNSSNIIPLYNALEGKPDRLERIQKLQEFFLQIVTLSGMTAPTVSQLYIDIKSEYLDQIRNIEEDQYLSTSAKSTMIQEVYSKYMSEKESEMDGQVLSAIREGSRAKVSQLMNIAIPQFTNTPGGSFAVGKTSLAEGMSQADYRDLCVMNRAVQAVKVTSVPQSGYLTRQFVYLALTRNYHYEPIMDPTNTGIVLKMKDAIGRTKLDGTLVPTNSSNEEVRVRSILGHVTTDTMIVPKKDAVGMVTVGGELVQPNNDGTPVEVYNSLKKVITADMLSSQFKYNPNANVMIDLITHTTEAITQGSLALKHGGSLFNPETNSQLKAPFDCTVDNVDLWIRLTDVNSGDVYLYPQPVATVQFLPKNGKFFTKGEVILQSQKTNTAAYVGDSMIALTKAKGVRCDKAFGRNRVLKSDCIAMHDGVLKYVIKGDRIVGVTIGGHKYDYNSECVYHIPNETAVKFGQRICSGIMNSDKLFIHTDSIETAFYAFRIQFSELLPGLRSECMEAIFKLLVDDSGKSPSIPAIQQSIIKSGALYTSSAFGWAKSQFKQVSNKGLQLNPDDWTLQMLPILLGM